MIASCQAGRQANRQAKGAIRRPGMALTWVLPLHRQAGLNGRMCCHLMG